MKTDKIRSLYADYFKAQHHKAFSSDSLVPANDPTVLFTGAGMNQFKAYFLGEKKDVKRATSCQKCIRTADLERVGETAYHHTFFEMLGNFSFGDYFKEEAIQYAWDFVTRELLIPKESLWVSVFEEDDEAFQIWKKKVGIDEKRIKRFGADDNFWPANAPKEGPNGPCGPCSEIYVGSVPGKGVEIWNLVFTQYDRQEDGFLKPLPQKNIDTGMGLERLASVLQGVASNFDIDIFVEPGRALARTAGEHVNKPENRKSKHALLDHIRAVTFSVADGVMPANEGRGYVIRKLIRKSVLHLKDLGIHEPQFYTLVPSVVEVMRGAYPELTSRAAGIASIIQKEEEGFWGVLNARVPQAEIRIKTLALTSGASSKEAISQRVTALVFEFYDTHGVPREILREIVVKNGLVIDEALFRRLAAEQRDRSRLSSALADSIFVRGETLFKVLPPASVFLGYEVLSAPGKIAGILVDGSEVAHIEKGQKGLIALDRTPFYGEQGGQIGDKGTIQCASGKALVKDARWHDRTVLHSVEVVEGRLKNDDNVEAAVDASHRERVMKNHTATHLLHAALGKVLGPHIKQNGSLVAADRLRFDFTHYGAMTHAQRIAVEDLVNGQIAKRINLTTRQMNTRDAIASGAAAFFGEKYGDSVRVVSAGDFSTELCGGTHCRNTEQIGLFRIVSEGSVQSGVRRIEAVTGDEAYRKCQENDLEVADLCAYLNTSRADLGARVSASSRNVTEMQRKLKPLFTRALKIELGRRLESSPIQDGVRWMVTYLPNIPPEAMRDAADALRSEAELRALILVGVSEEKPQFVVAFSKGLVSRGLDAGVLVKSIAAQIGGSGGGRPDMAVGGGKSGSDLEKAMRFAEEQLLQRLNLKQK